MKFEYDGDDVIEVFENLGHDTVSGEAVCIWYKEDAGGNKVDPPELIHTVKTGLYFEHVRQLLPIILEGKVVSKQLLPISPWNFPKPATVQKLADLIESRGYKVIGLSADDENEPFPVTHKSFVIVVDLGFNCRVNAGQLLRGIIAHIDAFGRQDLTVIDVELEQRKLQQS